MFGVDFFKIFNLVIQIMRLLAKTFGDEEDKKAAEESEQRSREPSTNDAC